MGWDGSDYPIGVQLVNEVRRRERFDALEQQAFMSQSQARAGDRLRMTRGGTNPTPTRLRAMGEKGERGPGAKSCRPCVWPSFLQVDL